MIQEQAVKTISKNLYQVLTSHFFREFTSKLQLEINKEPVTGGMISQTNNNHQQNMSQNNNMNMTSNSKGQRNTINQGTPQKNVQIAPGAVTMNQQQSQNHQQVTQKQVQKQMQQIFANSREDSLARGDTVEQQQRHKSLRKEDYIDNELGLASIEVAQRIQRASHDTPLNMSGSKAGNLIVQSILKMLEDKIPQAVKQATMQSVPATGNMEALFQAFQRAALKKIAATGVQMGGKKYKNAIGFDLDQIDNPDEKGFIRVGDIIIIIYDEKVFDELHDVGNVASKTKEGLAHLEQLEEKIAQKDNLKERITNKPDLIYKGIVYTDGVTNKQFNVMPRQIELNQIEHESAFTNFKKCLFRVEVAQECKYNIIQQTLKEHLEELEKRRALINEEKALQGKGSTKRGNKEVEEIDALYKEIEELENEIYENEKLLNEEVKNNQYEFQINVGKKITYGQKIQLKHLFSEQYLTLNTKKISHEHGCVSLQLSPANENSWFTIMPSEKVKQKGQSVSYLDTFHLQNFVINPFEKPLFFMHVNNNDIIKGGEKAIMEINGSYEPSKFRARMFLDYTHMKYDGSFFESGDIIRLKQEEANGYMTVIERNVELNLPEMPDFLQKQVNKIDGMAFGGANNSALIDILGDAADDADNIELREQARALLAQQNEIKRKNQNKVFIERDLNRLQFTNSCWEIQKVKTYKGGPILLNDVCRLKHVGTGKYLSVSSIDRRELILKDSIDDSDTLFCLRRESYRPPGKKGPKPSDGITGETVNPHDLIIIETFYHTYVHISEMIKENFNIDRSESGGVVQNLVEAKNSGKDQKKQGTTAFEEQEARAKAMQNALEHELHDDSMRIEPICGNYSRDDTSKMIFIFERLPASPLMQNIAYQSSSFFKSLHSFYEFLNMWAVDDVDAEELEILGFNNMIAADQIDKQKYDFQVARETDRQLLATVDEVEEQVVDQLINMISKAELIGGHDGYYHLQKYLSEQGILVMVVKLLELIYYKCSTPDERDRDLLGIDIEVNDNHEESPERIASEMLDPLAEKLLRLLYLLIKTNQANAEKLTKYDHIIFMMLTRYDAKLVSKIFKETYKRAKTIHGEHSKGGDGGFGNVMQKWVDRLESIKYLEGDENLSNQILYLNVISMMCRDEHGQGLYHYQMQAVQSILETPQKVPITFGVQRKEMDRPIVFIHRKLEETDDVFLRNNPRLRDVYKPNKSGANPELGASVVIDLYDMTLKNLSSNSKLQPYIEYIAAVINLYCHMCLSRNLNAVRRLKELGLTFEHIVSCISHQMKEKETKKASNKKKNEKQIEPLDKKLISVYIFAARVMYIDTNLFPTLTTYKNRCYFWDTIHKSDAHKTMYRWEKDKFFRGFEENNRSLKEETDQHEQLAMGQLRQQVYNFFSGMPDVLQTFLYSYDSRRYSKKDVTSVLTLMINFIDAATALISCELVDSKFIYRMLMASAMIFISYHYKDMPKTDEDKSWIYMVMQVAKKTKRCREKIEVLEYKALQMLEVICKFRMNSQILIFLQLFRQFVENNAMPHVSQMTTTFDAQFQVIFQLYQFNIGKNLTFKTIHRMAQQVSDGAVAVKGKGKAQQPRALKAAEDGDDGNKLLEIAEIRLTEDPNGEGGEDEEEEIDDQGNAIARNNGGLRQDDDDEDKGEASRRKKQYNDKYELDKFLLYLIFAKGTNHGVRNQAVKVLVANFNQRELLMNELTKIELIISTMDQVDYNEFMKQHFMLRGIIDRIHTLGIEMKASGGSVGRARDQYAYTRSIEDVTNILKGLTLSLEDHVNFILISVGEDQVIEQEVARLMKKQNMLRHIDIADDLINLLMKRVIESGLFQKDKHGEMFKEVSKFLFMFSFGSLSNQRTLVHHLNFLVSLTDLDVPTPKLVAQVLSQQRESEHGLRFLEFLTDKIVNHSSTSFKSSLFKLLSLMMSRPSNSSTVNNSNAEAVTIEANQIFVLKRLVKKPKFRKILYMDDDTSHIKLDIVLALNKRVRELKGFQQMTKADRIAYVAIEWEAYKLHASVIDLVSSCVRNCLFGRLQARKLASADHLFDAVLSEAIPFLLRRKYLRLLFEVYIRTVVEDTLNIDFNTKAFHDMMYYVVLEDLREYARYYTGLIAKVLPEAKRDNTTEALRKRTVEALQQKSVEDVRKRNMERTRQEMEIFKEERAKLSTLQTSNPIPLIDETDKAEYWKYLTQYKKSRNEADGLLHFIADFYSNIRRTPGKKMAKQLVQVTVQIRSILMEMSDDLNKINELYAEHLKDVDHTIIVIDQTLACIPNVRTFKAGKKFSVKGGAADAEEGEDVIVNEDDNDGDGVADEEEEEEEADNAAINGDDKQAAEAAMKRKKDRQEANISKEVDENTASDKILNIIRDTIVQEGTTIRQLFQIKNFEQNYIMPKLHLKKALKLIVSSQATNDEVEKFMKFIDKFSRDETEQRRTIQPDIANEGHIRTRVDPLKVLQLANRHSDHFNFRDLENLLRKQLQKIQYKPPVQKRPRDEMEEELKLEKAEDELSRACNTDLKLFTKCFFDFFQRFKDKDEIADIVLKITTMFNEAFDSEEPPVVKKFIENMISGFTNGKDKLYLLRILNMIIEYYLPTNPRNKHYPVKSRQRLKQLQVIMKDCKMLEILLQNITEDDLKISDEAIKLMSNMLCESNQEVQDQLLEIMKRNRDNFKFFNFMKNRLHSASDYLIQQQQEKIKLKKQFVESSRNFKENSIQALSNIYQQPFYLPSQAQNGQSVFNLETEIKKLSSQQSQDELLNILRLIQLLCDNCHQGFQDYLRNQEECVLDGGLAPLTTVNVVSEVAMVLIKLTERLSTLIFTDYILYETVGQVFDTLIDFLHGPNVENQKLLGQWKKLSKAVNFYLSQNMGYYSANTTELKAKLGIMKSSTDLLLALVESVDPQFKLSILQEMVPEVCVENLLDKMKEIFHFKVGIDEKKQRVYYSNKKCYHYRENTPIRRANLCEKDEFCEHGHLIKFDKEIIAAGFNIFIFLYNYKEVDPECETLEKFDSDFKNEKLYRKTQKAFEKEILQAYNITAEKYADKVQNNELIINEVVESKTLALLEEVTIKDPTTKIYPELAKKAAGDGENNLDESGEMEKRVFEIKEQDVKDSKNQKRDKKKAQKKNDGQGFFAKICCRRQNKINPPEGQGQISATNGDHALLLESFDQDLTMIDNNGASAIGHGSSFGVKNQVVVGEDIEAEELEKYDIEQFLMDTAIRFYSSNVASIEIDYKNSLSKVMFRIPPFCTFFTRSSQKRMIYEANHDSHIEKLEDFFNKKKIFKAEMKAIQRLSRRSKILRWGSEQWKGLSYITLGLVLIINLLFIVFYDVADDGVTINLAYRQAEITVELLGIIQAFLAFLVMAAYIMRYHGKIYEEYLEQFQMESKDRFTRVKGSLGYAFGAQVFKLAHQQASIQESYQHQLHKARDDEFTLERQKRHINREELVYAIKIFFYSMKLDTQHAFNVIYFILSVLGVFYHTIFSFLLLDIVIKIPLLQNVVQAIVQNRKQLFYTFVLLAIIIYIYSFIAFRVLRDSYLSVDTIAEGDGAPDQNLYCRTLLECFTSTINNGLRAGGGVGDLLDQISLDQNYDTYWARYVFDLTFFFLVTIILLNLIFGIIIDAFADMRDARNAVDSDVKERCFICGLNRFEFETKNKSWFDHIQKEHNAFAYLYFILYVQAKSGNQCTGVEKYVKALVLKEDPAFFPVGKCLSIGVGSDPNRENE